MVKYCPSCSFDLSSLMVKEEEPKKKPSINKKVSINNTEIPVELPDEIQDEDADMVNNIIDKLVIKKKSKLQTDHLKKMRDAKAKKALERKQQQAETPAPTPKTSPQKPVENNAYRPLFLF
jgi:hypothetical protein